VLIGDAVHAPPPTLAAGAAIALEDAVVLDEMLAAGGDVEATLRAFVDRRFERCKLVVEQSVARTRGIHRPDGRLRRRRLRAPRRGRACQALLVGR
jgi:2-polyprenyl-6-methoxyphenol hydroxylase-like FAD-dependent oxidoreductase